jgi:hypothetical protein
MPREAGCRERLRIFCYCGGIAALIPAAMIRPWGMFNYIRAAAITRVLKTKVFQHLAGS